VVEEGAKMNALFIVLGFVLLTTGQLLPWLFVAAAGFMFGNLIGQQPFLGLSGISLTLFSLGIAVIGGLLVIYFRKIMVVIAGFLAGAYICYYLPAALGWSTTWISWWVLIIAGIVSAAIILIWNALPLILVTSLTGSTLVIQYTSFKQIGELMIFVIFFLFGITAQWVLMQYNKPGET
jgi:hypothetical protein